MRYFPTFLDVDRSPVLVVGGGETALQKVRLLLKTSAFVKVVAPELATDLAGMAAAGRIMWWQGRFDPQCLMGCRLVFAAVGQREVDASIAFAARAHSIPVNVVDVPQLCTFITPAIVDRDPVVVAIGTERTAPVLAQRIKTMLEAKLPARLGNLADWARKLRPEVAAKILEGSSRRKFWQHIFAGSVAERHLAGDCKSAREAVDAALADTAKPCGRVSLVGAGPGDPDLLTFKAARALQDADVILFDRLVDPAILEVARRDARRIDVGKRVGNHPVRQDEINRILVEEAHAGHYVVRLKGGDPLIFGRAAEEIEALRSAGIKVDIVPGVTSALAAAASIGALVTERNERRVFSILTGHASDGPTEHDWAALAKNGQSLAIYMGVGTADRFQARLLAAGLAPSTHVIIVENASLPNQIAVTGTVGDMGDLIRRHGIIGPAVILIGPRATLIENYVVATSRRRWRRLLEMKVLTANRLREGDVVYWSDEGWRTAIFDARTFEPTAAKAALERIGHAETEAGRVVEPYLIDVEPQGETLIPVHYREQFRARGPSVRRDLGKQAA